MDWYTGKQKDPLREGIETIIDGQTFVVPKLRCGGYIKAMPSYDLLFGSSERKDNTAIMRAEFEIALIGLQQNYPEMTAEQLGDHLEPEDLVALFNLASRSDRSIKPGEAQAGSSPATVH